jgi:hypothetical protein
MALRNRMDQRTQQRVVEPWEIMVIAPSSPALS